jgi:hypothetical protein
MAYNLSEGLSIDQINSGTAQGEKVLDRERYLKMYGIDGKDFDVIAIAYPSIATFGKAETIQTKTFFSGKNPIQGLPNLEFPLKNKAMDISIIKVDIDLNFDDDMQKSLAKEAYFLKTSVLKTTLNRVEGISIPLEHCVPYAIEFNGLVYEKRIIREGFRLPAPIQVNQGGTLDVAIIPGQGFVTAATKVNPNPAGDNTITVSLVGREIAARTQG